MMRQADVQHAGRYVAKVDGQRTIVRAYRTRGGWRYRNEATGLFCRCSTRGLWRPAVDEERHDSETVQAISYRTQRSWMRDGQTVLPIVWIADQRPQGERQATPAVVDELAAAATAMAREAAAEGRRRLNGWAA